MVELRKASELLVGDYSRTNGIVTKIEPHYNGRDTNVWWSNLRPINGRDVPMFCTETSTFEIDVS